MNRKEKFFGWKIFLTIISFLLVIVTKSTINFNNILSNQISVVLLKEIGYDLFVGIFSAMVLVWFIDEINNRIQEEKSRNKEIEAIKRADNLLQQYIDRYIRLFYCVVTPIENRNFEAIEMPVTFFLSDMRDMYQPSLFVIDGIHTSIEGFLDIELGLREQIAFTVRNVNFDFFPSILEILLEFIDISLKYDCRNALFLPVKNKNSGNGDMMEIIEKMLKVDADDFYNKFLDGKIDYSSVLHTYIILYEMMNKERDVLLRYIKEIEKL